ncbi:MFS transporter [Staphylococcus caprae]|uniref:MFS transporter n=1 Tax=Staphylococcus caprae TaxID=29380 RepID=UPI0005CB62E4|nr:MFS transporter [Staphylococcus caprae]
MKKLMKNNTFRNYLMARTTVNFADSFYYLIILWTLQHNTGSTFYTSLVYASMTIAATAGIFVGPFIDNKGPKFLIYLSIIVQIFMLFLMVFISKYLLIIVFFLSLASSMFYSSEKTLFTSIVNRENYKLGNSIIGSTDQIINLLGYLAGGIILSLIGFKYSIGVNIFWFAIGLLIFVQLFMNIKGTYDLEKSNKQGDKRSLGKGLYFIFGNITIRIIFILSIISASIISLITVILPSVSVSYGSSVIYSLMYVCFFIGFLGGALLTNLMKIKAYKISILWVLCGFSLYAFSLSNSIYLIFISIVFFGFFSGIITIFLNTIVQLLTPDKIMGRTLSTFSTFNNVLSSVFVILGGYLTKLYDLKEILIVLAFLFVICGIFLTCIPKFMKQDFDIRER